MHTHLANITTTRQPFIQRKSSINQYGCRHDPKLLPKASAGCFKQHKNSRLSEINNALFKSATMFLLANMFPTRVRRIDAIVLHVKMAKFHQTTNLLVFSVM